MLEAISVAHEYIKKQCEFQQELTKATNKEQKREYKHHFEDETLKKLVYEISNDKIYEVISKSIVDKKERKKAISNAKKECEDLIIQKYQENEINLTAVNTFLNQIEKKAAREFLLTKHTRLDGRKPTDITYIESQTVKAHNRSCFY